MNKLNLTWKSINQIYILLNIQAFFAYLHIAIHDAVKFEICFTQNRFINLKIILL